MWITDGQKTGQRETLETESLDYRLGSVSAHLKVGQFLASNLGTLGLTPTDRSRLGVAEIHKSSKLEKMLEKRARRDVKSSPAKSVDSSSLLEENHDI